MAIYERDMSSCKHAYLPWAIMYGSPESFLSCPSRILPLILASSIGKSPWCRFILESVSIRLDSSPEEENGSAEDSAKSSRRRKRSGVLLGGGELRCIVVVV